ncbi:uncharacterized protein LOC117120885 [Anneissia japonica]|uniref:uncharacterized protein LOC117120885 n=1 Tax=Anneissia japonica TaxID=1529436 RepID=UPI001425853A|nr:uncharacterized protein LOC117120885 [Anneissia japonica]
MLACKLIIRQAQLEEFGEEVTHIKTSTSGLPKGNKLCRLNPFLNEDNLLCVGGRLHHSHLQAQEKHPILLPKNHHISKLVIHYYHQQTHHQGRQITHGSIRSAGYWIIGGRQMVATIIGKCVTCRRLRRSTETQIMADLPQDRIEPGPPFTNVGLDVFGPWLINARKTRGSSVNKKRWGVIFTCLASRAIHIEIVESMDTSAFICALRRFIAIRGPIALLRCDRGTNFIGAESELDQALSEIDQDIVSRHLTDKGCQLEFNPLHSSHFGGVWERQIRTVRQVFNAMMLELGPRQLTHELLTTLAEASAIVNSRPIVTISSDPNDPQPLTPNMLLTMKTRPLVTAP